LIFIWKIRAYKDLLLFFTSFMAANILGIELGIGITVAISLLLIVKHTSSPHLAILKQTEHDSRRFEEVAVIRDLNLFEDRHDYHFKNLSDQGVMIVRLDEPLYFANIGQLRELLSKLEQRGKTKLQERRKAPKKVIE